MDKDIDALLISKSKEIMYNNNLVGHIDISLTTSYYRTINRQFIWSIIPIILVNLISLIIMIRFLLQRFLQNPLNHFSEVVRNYASGNYEFAVLQASAIEFQPFVTVLSEMGDRITVQMDELQKAEKKYRLLIENQTDMVVTFDTAGRLLFVSPSYCETFDKTEEELLGKKFMHLIHGEDRETVANAIDNVYTPPYTGYVEEQAMTKDGWRWQSWLNTAILNEQGKIESIIAVGRDINDRKKAEKALLESEERYRNLFENAIEGIFQTTPEGGYISANPALAKIYGYESPEDLMKNISDIAKELYVDPNSRKEIIDLLKDKDFIYNFEVQTYCKDKSIVWTSENIRTNRNEFGELINYEGSVIDISDRKKAEEALRESESKLRQAQKMESIGTLAGGIAHEFNNILGIILGNTELAIDDVPEWNPANECLKEIRVASMRAKDVVRHILSFARKIPAQRKPIQISTIIRDSLKLMRASIPTTIEIRQNILCESEMILADPTEINQILMNLCTNAVHSMTADGDVLEVSLESISLDKDSVRQYENLNTGDFVKLTVKDTGQGIDPKVMDRIFDPYFTTKDIGKGTGMGLAVAYGIVKKYDGDIKASSELGIGTVVEVLFPLIEEVVEPEVKEEPEISPSGNERILFVDDEVSLVKMAEHMLERLGYEVVTKTNPREALAVFKAEADKFDLVITDMAMPHMAGDRLAQELMKIRKDIPVILCTGHSARIDEDRAKELGLAAYVMKPLVTRDFAKTVRKVLDEAKGSTQD